MACIPGRPFIAGGRSACRSSSIGPSAAGPSPSSRAAPRDEGIEDERPRKRAGRRDEDEEDDAPPRKRDGRRDEDDDRPAKSKKGDKKKKKSRVGEKSWLTAVLLCFFLGGLGVHRFYLGFNGIGVVQFLTAGGCFVWALIDFIMLLMNKLPDSEGNELER